MGVFPEVMGVRGQVMGAGIAIGMSYSEGAKIKSSQPSAAATQGGSVFFYRQKEAVQSKTFSILAHLPRPLVRPYFIELQAEDNPTLPMVESPMKVRLLQLECRTVRVVIQQQPYSRDFEIGLDKLPRHQT